MLRHVLSLTIPDVVVELVVLIMENLVAGLEFAGGVYMSESEMSSADIKSGSHFIVLVDLNVPIRLCSYSNSKSCSSL